MYVCIACKILMHFINACTHIACTEIILKQPLGMIHISDIKEDKS